MKHVPESGFTLIELMMAVAIGIILMTMAVPSFQNIVVNNRLATKTNELVADIAMARSEAVKQGRSAYICRSTNQTSCVGSGSDWTSGWLVWVDTDANGSLSSSEIVRVHESVSGISMSAKMGTTDISSIQYTANGFRSTATTANIVFTMTATGCTQNQARTVTIIATGRPSVTTAACS